MGKQGKHPAETRERAVRLVFDHQGEYESQWAAVTSIASKVGCSRESLRKTWIGFVYVAFIIDVFSRMIVGRHVSPR